MTEPLKWLRERRTAEIRKRFPPRETLKKMELARSYFAQFDEQQVLDLLGLLELEFNVDVGFLRPGDRLDQVCAPIPTWNPLLWTVYRGLETDGVNEISYELSLRRRRRELPEVGRERLRSLSDLVEAWCEKNTRRE